jgi:hypothetical protein
MGIPSKQMKQVILPVKTKKPIGPRASYQSLTNSVQPHANMDLSSLLEKDERVEETTSSVTREGIATHMMMPNVSPPRAGYAAMAY